MKICKLIALLVFCNYVSAQDVIATKSGSIAVAEGSIHVTTSGKKLIYKKTAESKSEKIKVKDIISATYKDRQFVTYRFENKVRGGFLLTEKNGLKLIALTAKRSVSKGGFDVPYMRYELSIVGDSVVKHLIFTDVNNQRNILLRKEATDLIRQNFADCSTIITRLNSFESDKKDIENPEITGFLDNPYFSICY